MNVFFFSTFVRKSFCKLDFYSVHIGSFFLLGLRELTEGFDWMNANVPFIHPLILLLSILRARNCCKVTQHKAGMIVGGLPPLNKNITEHQSNELKTMLITDREQKAL